MSKLYENMYSGLVSDAACISGITTNFVVHLLEIKRCLAKIVLEKITKKWMLSKISQIHIWYTVFGGKQKYIVFFT